MFPRLRRSAMVVGALVTLAAAAATGATAQAAVFRVSVTRAAAGRPIAPDFLGLALEYNTIPKVSGTTPQAVDPVFAQLLRNLDPGGRPVIRVGGLSTDRVWWPVPGMARPLGVTYNLTPAWAADARSLSEATGARYLLGINLMANRTRIAQREGAQLARRIGTANIAALQVGNEPDLYSVLPWYKTLHGKPVPWYSRQGTPVYPRPPGYSAQDYAREFERTVRVLPKLPLAGPEAGTASWMSMFSRFLSPHSQVRMLTSHFYGLNNCITDPSQPEYPSLSHLLSAANSRDALDGIAAYVGRAHADGAAYRVDEMGSISCNGRAGVSNTLASALWLMDSLFDIASGGVDGVNLHSYPNSANGLFDFTRTAGHWQGIVHPLYYGALMFAQAAPAGSRRLRVRSGGQSVLRAWATRGVDHRIRVLLINDSLRSSATTIVHAAGTAGAAAVERLQGPGAGATGHITLGGASFGPRTPTGVLPAPRLQAVTARSGSYTVTLPAASAALLTIPAG